MMFRMRRLRRERARHSLLVLVFFEGGEWELPKEEDGASASAGAGETTTTTTGEEGERPLVLEGEGTRWAVAY